MKQRGGPRPGLAIEAVNPRNGVRDLVSQVGLLYHSALQGCWDRHISPANQSQGEVPRACKFLTACHGIKQAAVVSPADATGSTARPVLLRMAAG